MAATTGAEEGAEITVVGFPFPGLPTTEDPMLAEEVGALELTDGARIIWSAGIGFKMR